MIDLMINGLLMVADGSLLGIVNRHRLIKPNFFLTPGNLYLLRMGRAVRLVSLLLIRIDRLSLVLLLFLSEEDLFLGLVVEGAVQISQGHNLVHCIAFQILFRSLLLLSGVRLRSKVICCHCSSANCTSFIHFFFIMNLLISPSTLYFYFY